MTTWEKYILRDLVKVMLLFLGTFYVLYVLIDYSNNSAGFAKSGVSLVHLGLHYLCDFAKQLEILLPFALMVAALRTLTSMNINNEIVALMSGGVSPKRLARPFLLVAFACVVTSYINFELLLPTANETLHELKKERKTAKRLTAKRNGEPSSKKRPKPKMVKTLRVRDKSTLLYQEFDKARERFFDVVWVRSGDEIYRIKYLYPDAERSVGSFVDRIIRDSEGRMTLAESYDSFTFEELGFEEEVLGKALTPASQQTIRQLWRNLPAGYGALSDEDAVLLTRFYSSLATPWLAILMVIGPFPTCTRFSRNTNVYLIYGTSIVGFLTFFTVLNATIILGENQVVPPLFAAWGPFLASYGVVGYRFLRMK